MKKLNSLIVTAAVAAVLAVSSTASFAQQGGGVKIGGNVNQFTLANRVNTLALGQDAKAITRIGAIGSGTDIRGNVNQFTLANRVNTLALGRGATACTEIGVIGESECNK